MSEKTYIKGITIKEGKYGLRVSFNLRTFIEQAEQLQNDKGYLNIDINKRKEAGKYGETHYATLNEWKPNENSYSEQNAQNNVDATTQNLTDTEDDSGLPF